MTKEEWDALSPEEKEARKTEDPNQPPPAPTPSGEGKIVLTQEQLENIISETVRKTVGKQPPPQPFTQSQPSGFKDSYDRIAKAAEQEMVETGRAFPIETFIGLINLGASTHAKTVVKTEKQANKVIKDVKRELRKEIKEFTDIEDEFDEAVENLDYAVIKPETLKFIANGLRVRILEKKIPKSPEDIVPAPSKSSTSGPIKTPKAKLTPAQQKECSEQFEGSEEDYLDALRKRQDRAKAKGCAITPQTMSEPLQFPR